MRTCVRPLIVGCGRARIAPAKPEGEPLMIKTIVLSAFIAAGLALAPAYAQDSMKKDTMSQSKDTMAKDGMKKDSMAKDTMAKDKMSKDQVKKDEMKK